MNWSHRGLQRGQRTTRRRTRGQSLVEAALVLPTFLILALGVADIGRGFTFREDLANATRDAGRVAALSGQENTGDTACAGKLSGTASAVANIPAVAFSDSTFMNLNSGIGRPIVQAVALESSSDGTAANSKLSGAVITVTWNCLANKAITNTTATTKDPNAAGNGSATIEVKITYKFNLITPLASNVASPTLQSDIFVRAEY